MVYVYELYNNNPDDAFNSNGIPLGYVFPSLECGEEYTDKFIFMAQKVFRKKQTTLDIINMWALPVQPISEITALRQKMEIILESELFKFSRNDYENAKKITEISDWLRYYNQSINDVNAIK